MNERFPEDRDMLADPLYRSRRLAFVAASTLAKGQLLRALDGRPGRTFEDPSAAEAWLFQDESEAEIVPLRRIA